MLTPYGLREWLAATVIAAVIGIGLAWAGWWWGLVALIAVWLAVLAFFRDPIRRVPTGLADGALLSPADGRITAVERVDGHPAVGDRPAVIIRMFLSVLDVHVNRAPADGEVTAVEHTPGRYLDARHPDSPSVNESNLIVLRRPSGEPLGVRQIAGKVARRIVCELGPGSRVARGQRFGMIKFGSGAEVIVPDPDAVEVKVRVGDKVRGGLTVLAVAERKGTKARRHEGTKGRA